MRRIYIADGEHDMYAFGLHPVNRKSPSTSQSVRSRRGEKYLHDAHPKHLESDEIQNDTRYINDANSEKDLAAIKVWINKQKNRKRGRKITKPLLPQVFAVIVCSLSLGLLCGGPSLSQLASFSCSSLISISSQLLCPTHL